MDEDAGCLAGVPRAVRQPLVDDHEDQVAEEAEEEEQLRHKQQVDAELLLEVPAKEVEEKENKRMKLRASILMVSNTLQLKPQIILIVVCVTYLLYSYSYIVFSRIHLW